MGILSIKIKIGDRDYPMKVEESEEETIRMAGRLLNEKLKSYREQFGIDDRQDLMAMVAFDCLTQQLRSESSKTSIEYQLSEKLTYLHQVVSKSLADS